jgi:hypothetical protein
VALGDDRLLVQSYEGWLKKQSENVHAAYLEFVDDGSRHNLEGGGGAQQLGTSPGAPQKMTAFLRASLCFINYQRFFFNSYLLLSAVCCLFKFALQLCEPLSTWLHNIAPHSKHHAVKS